MTQLDNSRPRDVVSQWPQWMQPLGRGLAYLPGSRAVWKFITGTFWNIPGDIVWNIDQQVRVLKLSMTTSSRKERLRQYLVGHIGIVDTSRIYFTLTSVSRKMGNRDNHIKNMLTSFHERTTNVGNFEILIKIDSDDDLGFYVKVKKKFQGLNIRFFVTPRGAGYSDLHLSYSFLLDQMQSTSLAWLNVTDDVLFCRDGWDSHVFSLIDEEIPFIVGSQPADRVTKLNGPHPLDPFGRYSYESENYPILSRSVLEGLRIGVPDIKGWTLLGDRFCIDTFVSDLILTIQTKYKKDIYRYIDKYCDRYYRRFSWTDNKDRSDIRSESLGHFFEESSIEIRNQMVKQIFAAGLLDNLPPFCQQFSDC